MHTEPSLNSVASRRQFLKTSSLAAGAVIFGMPSLVEGKTASSKLNVAVIGLGGQGMSRLKEAIGCGANIVALCDVDSRMVGAAKAVLGAKRGKANLYTDYQKLLEREKNLGGVIIATPDHWHARICQAAFESNKHIFCEKPLTRTISEARDLRERARASKVVTQMGNQGSAANTMRRGIELIDAGVIGQVREVHVWVAPSTSFKPGQSLPVGEDPLPAELDWDRWIGPSPFHPYKKGAYHPRTWRAWYDFGGGSMGDWGCHGMNLPFRSLKLDYPTEVESDISGRPAPSYPEGVRIRYQFAARGALPAVTVWWYDGGRLPSVGVVPKSVIDHFGEMPKGGVLVLGDKGFTFGAPHPGAEYIQLSDEKKLSGILNHRASHSIPKSLPRVSGHMEEWLECCQTGLAPYSNFEVGGHLTEICLSGVVALQTAKKLEWDGPGMKAVNMPEADPFIHAKYRAGWI
jgi:predicted dehydrogenase